MTTTKTNDEMFELTKQAKNIVWAASRVYAKNFQVGYLFGCL